jgi:hypothetical protein
VGGALQYRSSIAVINLISQVGVAGLLMASSLGLLAPKSPNQAEKFCQFWNAAPRRRDL